MAGLTPGKIVLLVVSVAALSVSLFFAFRDRSGVELATEIVYVDVTNGDLFYVPYGRGTKGGIIPAQNPDTDERTLFKVRKDDAGNWKLDMRYAAPYAQLFNDQIVLNAETGELANVSGSPRKLR